MDEIKLFQNLVRASSSRPSGVGDIRDAVWKGIDAAGSPAADATDADAAEYRYINLASMRISSMAAALMLSCAIAGYVVVNNFLHDSAMLSSYYDMLDTMYSVIWGVY